VHSHGYCGLNPMGAAFFGGEAKVFGAYVCDGRLSDEDSHFFASDFNELCQVVFGWVSAGWFEEGTDWCVFGGTRKGFYGLDDGSPGSDRAKECAIHCDCCVSNIYLLIVEDDGDGIRK
jgi:hypothetical protein